MLAELRVESASLTSSRSGTIGGVIALRYGNEYFPESDWHDLPGALLPVWLSEMLRLLRGEADRSEFLFMDGPFAFSLSRHGSDQWVLAIQVQPKVETSIGIVDGRMLTRSALQAARDLLSAARQHGWTGRDLAHLQATVTRAERTLA